MIEQFLLWFSPVIAIGGAIGSWFLLNYKVSQQKVTNTETQDRITVLATKVTDLEKREGIADSKRADMIKVQEETRQDVKMILQKIAELATMISLANSQRKDD